MTASLTEWSEEESLWVDRIAAAMSAGRRLTADKGLWDALASDREEAPYIQQVVIKEKHVPPTHCAGCGTRFRPARSNPADHPGAVLHNARGHCARCYRAGLMHLDPIA